MKKTTGAKSVLIILAVLMTGLNLSPNGLAAEDSFSGSGFGADSPAAAGALTPSPQDPSQPVAEDTTRLNIERMPDGKFFLDFKDAPLINVLNVIASLSGINFVAGKELAKRQVNMTLDNITLYDALEALALGCNITYEYLPGRNIYLFRGTSDDDNLPILMTKVFKFYYIRVTKPKDIEAGSTSSGSSGSQLTTLKEQKKTDLEGESIFKTVTKMLSKRGKVSVDERSNSLVVTDIETRLKMIEAALKELDQPLKQVLINVFLIETYEDLDRELGIRWGDDNGVFGTIYGGTENTSFPFFTKTGSNNTTGDWLTHITDQFNPTKNTAPGTGPNISTATSGVRDFSTFQIRIQAMENAQKLNILAKPKILVLDNHAALIKISTNAAISENTVTTGGGSGTTSTTIERSEVGTILRVTPLISSENKVTLTVEPTFATVAASQIPVTGVAGETGDPTVRQARTTLMVNDGQTIALGGLLFSDQSKEVRKVPFFGNIPGIGKAFFTTTSRLIKDRELILFMTPFIIADPSVLETVTVPDHRLRFQDETDPFWKLKGKEWFKNVKQPQEKTIDYERYFDVRKRLMDVTLDTLDQKTAK